MLRTSRYRLYNAAPFTSKGSPPSSSLGEGAPPPDESSSPVVSEASGPGNPDDRQAAEGIIAEE